MTGYSSLITIIIISMKAVVHTPGTNRVVAPLHIAPRKPGTPSIGLHECGQLLPPSVSVATVPLTTWELKGVVAMIITLHPSKHGFQIVGIPLLLGPLAKRLIGEQKDTQCP